MFNPFKKKVSGAQITVPVTGMHCSSCAMTIDDALEETRGVTTSKTSYAKSQTTIEYDPEEVTEKALKKVIADQGYQVR